MSEERMAILRMLSEGKISVDEAGKLLEVVGEGAQGEQDAQESREERRQPRDFGEFFDEIGEEVRRAVSSVHEGDIGNTVRKEVDKAVKTVQGLDLGNVANEVVDQVKVAVVEAVDGAADREIVDDEEWIFDEAGIVSLDAETGNGNIVFQAGGGSSVKVHAHTKIKAHTREEAEAFAEEVSVHAESTGETVRVYKQHPKPPRGVSVTINYEIEGPRHLDLALRTQNGNATASGSEGKVVAQSTNGNAGCMCEGCHQRFACPCKEGGRGEDGLGDENVDREEESEATRACSTYSNTSATACLSLRGVGDSTEREL